jgi:hypothetical protein
MKGYYSSEFYCAECGNRNIPIGRNTSKKRGKKHIKDLYCVHCKKITKNIELNEKYTLNDFRNDYNKGEFKQYESKKETNKSVCYSV